MTIRTNIDARQSRQKVRHTILKTFGIALLLLAAAVILRVSIGSELRAGLELAANTID
jgi:hypothetical protein